MERTPLTMVTMVIMTVREMEVATRAQIAKVFAASAWMAKGSSIAIGPHTNSLLDQATVVQVVYKTMSATFSGPIGGYVTVHQGQSPPTVAPKPSPKPDAQSKESPKETPTPAKETPKETPKNTPSQQEQTPHAQKTSSAEPTAIRPPQQTQSESETALAKATGTPSPTQLALDGNRAHSGAATPTIDAASTSSTPSSVSAASSGTSAGAKAGIAIGVLGGVFVIGLLVFFLVSRRRKQAQAEQLMDDNEKVQPAPPPPVQPRAITPVIAVSPPVSPPMSPAMSPEPIDDMPVRTNPNAPRISLRPVTQFLPNWNLEKQAAAAAAAGGVVGVAVTGDGSDRPNTSQSDHPANPFGQQAERVPSPIHEDATVFTPYTPSEMSVSDSASISEIPHAEEAVAATAVAASAVAAGAAGAVAGAATLARKQSMRNRNPNNVDLTVNTLATVPPSPAVTDFSVSSPAAGSVPTPQPSQSAAAIAAAGGPANSTVHRVQLDFKPTLDDELELKAGDLIRLLHEYDDGWVST